MPQIDQSHAIQSKYSVDRGWFWRAFLFVVLRVLTSKITTSFGFQLENWRERENCSLVGFTFWVCLFCCFDRWVCLFQLNSLFLSFFDSIVLFLYFTTSCVWLDSISIWGFFVWYIDVILWDEDLLFKAFMLNEFKQPFRLNSSVCIGYCTQASEIAVLWTGVCGEHVDFLSLITSFMVIAWIILC